MRAREVIAIIERDGWYQARSKGSHLQFKHPSKPGLVTVPNHGSAELDPWLLKSIERQSGLKIRPG